MKKLIPLGLFLLFAFFTIIESETQRKNNVNNSDDSYSEGILKTEKEAVSITSSYRFTVDFNPTANTIYVKQLTTWWNNTENPTSELQFHLYQNAYSNNNTLFSSGRRLPPESTTRFDFSKILINGKPVSLEIFHPDFENQYDSTTAKIKLSQDILPGDSVLIEFEYSLKSPFAFGRSGFSANKTLYFFSQWFPKLGVFKNGNWICSQFHPFTEFYSDFSRYEVTISAPEEFLIASTGVKIDSTLGNDGKILHKIVQYGVHDFAWGAVRDIVFQKDQYERKDGTIVTINGFIQKNNEQYSGRNFDAVKNSLSFFEEYVAPYPYESITFIDVPKNSGTIASMEYPTLFTFKTSEFSPLERHTPEETIIHEFSHQYFYGIVANNEVYEAWLDEGFANYFTSKILDKYYPPRYAYFDFFGYYPIKGALFLEIAEIPLVYTLSDFLVPAITTSLKYYYKGTGLGSLKDTSYKLINRNVYTLVSYSKAEIMLQTLEKSIGFEKMMEIMKHYYNSYKFKHPVADDFWGVVNKYSGTDLSWLYEGAYQGSSYSDYKIISIDERDNRCNVWVQRNGEIKVPQTIALYTERDTLLAAWNGEERVKKIEFVTSNVILGAEIDPERKNLFDLNFANNSYLKESQFKGTLSIALRWFFWIQNLLMISGGLS